MRMHFKNPMMKNYIKSKNITIEFNKELKANTFQYGFFFGPSSIILVILNSIQI